PYMSGLHMQLKVPLGGVIGTQMNKYIFNNFGTAGATIMFVMLGFVSCLFLTNFHLGQWVRAMAERKPKEAGTFAPSEREVALEKRERELERQIQEQSGKPASAKAAAATVAAVPAT